jgi:Protein of unknown function (DUF4242)
MPLGHRNNHSTKSASAREIFLGVNIIIIVNTSKFIDIHSLGRYSDKELKGFQELPIDEYGVRVLNIFYNRAAGITFCYLEAPTKEAVEKHHEKYGVKCNWITEIEATA